VGETIADLVHPSLAPPTTPLQIRPHEPAISEAEARALAAVVDTYYLRQGIGSRLQAAKRVSDRRHPFRGTARASPHVGGWTGAKKSRRLAFIEPWPLVNPQEWMWSEERSGG
jgi:hypothetical protein